MTCDTKFSICRNDDGTICFMPDGDESNHTFGWCDIENKPLTRRYEIDPETLEIKECE